MKPRKNPQQLAAKLKKIRLALHHTQSGMIKRLGAEGELFQSHISAYENPKNNRLPSYTLLLRYARLAGVSTDILIDDELELPDQLPVIAKKTENAS